MAEPWSGVERASRCQLLRDIGRDLGAAKYTFRSSRARSWQSRLAPDGISRHDFVQY